MREITLRGTPFERGFQHGKAFADEIRSLIERECALGLGGMPRGQVEAVRDNMVAYLQKYEPQMVEEIKGVAAGSGTAPEEIFEMNSLSAIGALASGCTNIILEQSDDGPVLGKTSDIGEDYRYYLLQRVYPDEGYAFLGVGWVGSLWPEAGINEQGVVIGQSSAPIQPDQRGYGIPTLLYPRLSLLRCANTEEVIALSEARDMAGKGLNIAVLDRNGEGVILERSGTKQAVRRSERGIVFCTNHFVSEEMQGMIPLSVPGVSGLRENSEGRFRRLGSAFAHQEPPYPVSLLKRLLSSHEDEGGVCQHVSIQMTTHYAFLLYPEKREMWITDGPPCENEFVRYTL